MKLHKITAALVLFLPSFVMSGDKPQSMLDRLEEYQAQARKEGGSVVSVAIKGMDEEVLVHLAKTYSQEEFINQMSPSSCSCPLQKAIWAGKRQAFNLFLQLAADCSNAWWLHQANWDGRKPLHYLVEQDNFGFPELSMLLNRGVDVNDRAQAPIGGSTVLHLVGALGGKPETISYLLKKGADPTLLDEDEQTATAVCAKSYDASVGWMSEKEEKAHAECLRLLQEADREWAENWEEHKRMEKNAQ